LPLAKRGKAQARTERTAPSKYSQLLLAIAKTGVKRAIMTEITLNSDQLKEVLKATILELFQENREEFSKLLSEIIEDIAMERAIQEGEETEPVSREAIFKILEP